MPRQSGRLTTYARHRHATAGIAGALFAIGGAPQVAAQEIIDQQLQQPSAADFPSAGRWNATVGVGGALSPRFDGSNIYHATAIPFGNVTYDELGFLAPQGLGAYLFNSKGFRAGLVVGYGGARDQSADQHLHDLGNISSAVLAGGFLSYRWDAWEASLLVRQAVTHSSNGLEGTLGLTYTLRPSDRWIIRGGPYLAFADAAHMKKYFGISAEQSRATGLGQYSLGAGIMDVALGVSATYRLTTHWLIFGIARISEIVGDAGNSPIVQNSDQAYLGLGLAYHF